MTMNVARNIKHLCPYLLKFVDVDLVVNVDVSLIYDQNGIH